MGKRNHRRQKRVIVKESEGEISKDVDVGILFGMLEQFMQDFSAMNLMSERCDKRQHLVSILKFWLHDRIRLSVFLRCAECLTTDLHNRFVEKVMNITDNGEWKLAEVYISTHQTLLKVSGPNMSVEEKLDKLSKLLVFVEELIQRNPKASSLETCTYFVQTKVRMKIWLICVRPDNEIFDRVAHLKVYVFGLRPQRINILYRSSTSNVTLEPVINPTIHLKTLVMLVWSLHSISDKSSYEIHHVDRFGDTVGKLLLDHSGDKTLVDIGIEGGDTVRIVDSDLLEKSDNNVIVSKRARRKSKKKTRKAAHASRDLPPKTTRPSLYNSSKKQSNATQPDYSFNDGSDKINHSKNLTSVFEEASELFRERRRRLNELVLEKCPSKDKSMWSKANDATLKPVYHESTVDVYGKAGKPVYHVVVGSQEHLFKTSKYSRYREVIKPHKIDLHGFTKEDALVKLNDSLPAWIDEAMKEHPWTINVNIITGCGNQILADTVEQWIRENGNVTKRYL